MDFMEYLMEMFFETEGRPVKILLVDDEYELSFQ